MNQIILLFGMISWVILINNDAKNYREFTWSSIEEPEDSSIQGILVCCLFSMQIDHWTITS